MFISTKLAACYEYHKRSFLNRKLQSTKRYLFSQNMKKYKFHGKISTMFDINVTYSIFANDFNISVSQNKKVADKKCYY